MSDSAQNLILGGIYPGEYWQAAKALKPSEESNSGVWLSQPRDDTSTVQEVVTYRMDGGRPLDALEFQANEYGQTVIWEWQPVGENAWYPLLKQDDTPVEWTLEPGSGWRSFSVEVRPVAPGAVRVRLQRRSLKQGVISLGLRNVGFSWTVDSPQKALTRVAPVVDGLGNQLTPQGVVSSDTWDSGYFPSQEAVSGLVVDLRNNGVRRLVDGVRLKALTGGQVNFYVSDGEPSSHGLSLATVPMGSVNGLDSVSLSRPQDWAVYASWLFDETPADGTLLSVYGATLSLDKGALVLDDGTDASVSLSLPLPLEADSEYDIPVSSRLSLELAWTGSQWRLDAAVAWIAGGEIVRSKSDSISSVRADSETLPAFNLEPGQTMVLSDSRSVDGTVSLNLDYQTDLSYTQGGSLIFSQDGVWQWSSEGYEYCSNGSNTVQSLWCAPSIVKTSSGVSQGAGLSFTGQGAVTLSPGRMMPSQGVDYVLSLTPSDEVASGAIQILDADGNSIAQNQTAVDAGSRVTIPFTGTGQPVQVVLPSPNAYSSPWIVEASDETTAETLGYPGASTMISLARSGTEWNLNKGNLPSLPLLGQPALPDWAGVVPQGLKTCLITQGESYKTAPWIPMGDGFEYTISFVEKGYAANGLTPVIDGVPWMDVRSQNLGDGWRRVTGRIKGTGSRKLCGFGFQTPTAPVVYAGLTITGGLNGTGAISIPMPVNDKVAPAVLLANLGQYGNITGTASLTTQSGSSPVFTGNTVAWKPNAQLTMTPATLADGFSLFSSDLSAWFSVLAPTVWLSEAWLWSDGSTLHQGKPLAAWRDVEWTPLLVGQQLESRTYRFPYPVLASYLKIEVTQLQPVRMTGWERNCYLYPVSTKARCLAAYQTRDHHLSPDNTATVAPSVVSASRVLTEALSMATPTQRWQILGRLYATPNLQIRSYNTPWKPLNTVLARETTSTALYTGDTGSRSKTMENTVIAGVDTSDTLWHGSVPTSQQIPDMRMSGVVGNTFVFPGQAASLPLSEFQGLAPGMRTVSLSPYLTPSTLPDWGSGAEPSRGMVWWPDKGRHQYQEALIKPANGVMYHAALADIQLVKFTAPSVLPDVPWTWSAPDSTQGLQWSHGGYETSSRGTASWDTVSWQNQFQAFHIQGSGFRNLMDTIYLPVGGSTFQNAGYWDLHPALDAVWSDSDVTWADADKAWGLESWQAPNNSHVAKTVYQGEQVDTWSMGSLDSGSFLCGTVDIGLAGMLGGSVSLYLQSGQNATARLVLLDNQGNQLLTSGARRLAPGAWTTLSIPLQETGVDGTVGLGVELSNATGAVICTRDMQVKTGSVRLFAISGTRKWDVTPALESDALWSLDVPVSSLSFQATVLAGGQVGGLTVTPEWNMTSGTAPTTPTVLTVDDITVAPNGMAMLTVEADGQPVAGRACQFTIANPEVAWVSPYGMVEALKQGTTTITVQYMGLNATAAIKVK